MLARSTGRVDQERAIRRRKLRRPLARLHELRKQSPERDKLLMALGAAKQEAGRFYAVAEHHRACGGPGRERGNIFLSLRPPATARGAPA